MNLSTRVIDYAAVAVAVTAVAVDVAVAVAIAILVGGRLNLVGHEIVPPNVVFSLQYNSTQIQTSLNLYLFLHAESEHMPLIMRGGGDTW